MTSVKKKIEEVAEEDVEVVNDTVTKVSDEPFPIRFAKLGALLRLKAGEQLKFDSEVSNIDYVYVDTQQYKNLVGLCCDALGIGFICNALNEDMNIQTDNKGVMVFVGTVTLQAVFFDPFAADPYDSAFRAQAVGMGVSRGSGYALGVAQTNAMRNLLTNMFLLSTSDRESDDVRENIKPTTFLTDSAKAEKREELLEKTKSNSIYATITYGTILKMRIDDVLKKDGLDESFRNTLETFVANKFKDGKPIPLEEGSDFWIVKKTAAARIMSDLDEVV